MRKAYLVFSDGTVFEGEGFGAEVSGVGEIVFNTSVVGYLETLTDAGYAGQIVVQTFPLIGNYGVIEADFQGPCCVNGYVVREWCDTPSNFRCEGDLDAYLKEQGVPGICGVDTRAITRKIRSGGVTNAMICAELPEDLSGIKNYRYTGGVAALTCSEPVVCAAEGEEKHHVVLVDYGARRSLPCELSKLGCRVTCVPAGTSAEAILAMQPDGVLLSNGPGDPGENTACIAEIGRLMGKVPVLGVGLGHLMAAIAMGAGVEKMPYGHRGSSQPVKEADGSHTYITSQNHGYAVNSASVVRGAIRFVNANDGTCEGIDYPELNAFTVQFHPESGAGPLDTSFVFKRFISMMGGEN